MEDGNLAACGGPNFPPPEDSLVPAAVAVSPGGPTHVLISDEVAEHIAGCNMAFRRDALLANWAGSIRSTAPPATTSTSAGASRMPATRSASAPAAIVWHFRRNTVKAYINQQRGYGKAEALVYAKHPFRFNLFGQAKWLGRIYGDLSAALLLSRKPVIYSGTFGRGLFQTMYEPPSSLTSLLPLTFEWSVAALLLALAGIVGGGWWWLLAAPLLTTWAMCVNGALKAPIDPRFTGAQGARAGRAADLSRAAAARLGAHQMAPQDDADAGPHPARAGRAARRASSGASAPSCCATGTRAAAEKEVLLGGLMDFLLPQKYFVVADTGWSKWDLKIARGLWSRALVTVVAENHGGAKRLLRVRCAMRMLEPRPRAAAQLRGAGGRQPDPRRAVGGGDHSLPLGLVNLGVIGWQLVDVRPADAPHHRGGGAAGQADAGRADRAARAADRQAANRRRRVSPQNT